MIEVDIDKKIQLIKTILDDVYEIMITFKPIIQEVIKLEEARKYKDDGTLLKAATLFGSIAKKCKELELYPFNKDFLDNIEN